MKTSPWTSVRYTVSKVVAICLIANLAPAPLVTKELLLSIVTTSPTLNLLPAVIFSIKVTSPVVPSIVTVAVAPLPSLVNDFIGTPFLYQSLPVATWPANSYAAPAEIISGWTAVSIGAAILSTIPVTLPSSSSASAPVLNLRLTGASEARRPLTFTLSFLGKVLTGLSGKIWTFDPPASIGLL